jgi:hypothetical protein
MCLRTYISPIFFLIGISLLNSAVNATQLDIRFRGPNGEPIKISRAELLLVAWGAPGGRLELNADGDLLRMDLSPDWLRSRWPDRFADMEKAYVYVQAAGYAPIRSEPFLWLGSHDVGPHGEQYGQRVAETKIDFRRGRSVTVREEEKAELDVVLRKPAQRRLRFLNGSGEPVANLKIDVKMFWSESNHCGGLAGADLLVHGVTGSKGDLNVPDGDFQYVFEIEDPHVVFDYPESDDYPRRVIMYLHDQSTTLRAHHFERSPLLLDVLSDQGQLPGAVLYGNLSGCPCGACYGVMATSDGQGQIRIRDFYPEEYSELWLCVDEREVWTIDPGKLSDDVTKIRVIPAKFANDPISIRCKP